MTLEDRKEWAKEELRRTREEYLVSGTQEAWIAFCKAKRVCRLLGVII
ncbi:MAG: DUF2800 domain-containing protein [Oscillospiraceae bacterium]